MTTKFRNLIDAHNPRQGGCDFCEDRIAMARMIDIDRDGLPEFYICLNCLREEILQWEESTI